MHLSRSGLFMVVLLAIMTIGFFTACATSTTSEEGGESIVMVASVPAGDMYAGGLVWNNWTNIIAGGTGSVPKGVANKDYLRCKACHGWDALGADGGYARRSGFPEKISRPRPTEGTNLSAKLGSVTLEMASHQGGRAWAVENGEAPNLTQAGGMTNQQLTDVVAFLNDGPKISDVARIDISRNPVQYNFIGASVNAGKNLYAANCQACHGAGGDQLGDLNLMEYLRSDGKYSEAFHKMIYGAGPGMTREMSGSLNPAEARDILAWAQTAIK